MHAQRPRLFWALFAFVVSAGTVVSAVGLMAGRLTAGAVLGVVAVVAVFETSSVIMNEDMKTSLSIVALFAAIAYGGLPLAVVAGLSIGLLSIFTAKTHGVIKGAYNSGMDAVMAAGGAVVFSVVSGNPVLAPLPGQAMENTLGLAAGLLVAGVVYSLINGLLMAGVVHAANGLPFGTTFRGVFVNVVRLQFVYVGLGAIAYVMLVRVGLVALLLLTVPLVVARQSLLSVQERQEAFDRMVRAFVKAIELKDGYTRGHAERVSDLSVLVAERMGLSYEDRQLIRYGAILHDVGKIGVSLGILCKAGPLDDDEFAEMKLHPEIGAEMLADIDFLKPALAVVHHHHERMDGRGYPAGLAGDEIPLLTRVVTAVDAFDAMTSTRSYRRALPIEVALEELQANAGTQFDTEVVRNLVAVIAEQGWQVTDEPVAMAAAASPTTTLAMP